MYEAYVKIQKIQYLSGCAGHILVKRRGWQVKNTLTGRLVEVCCRGHLTPEQPSARSSPTAPVLRPSCALNVASGSFFHSRVQLKAVSEDAVVINCPQLCRKIHNSSDITPTEADSGSTAGSSGSRSSFSK